MLYLNFWYRRSFSKRLNHKGTEEDGCKRFLRSNDRSKEHPIFWWLQKSPQHTAGYLSSWRLGTWPNSLWAGWYAALLSDWFLINQVTTVFDLLLQHVSVQWEFCAATQPWRGCMVSAALFSACLETVETVCCSEAFALPNRCLIRALSSTYVATIAVYWVALLRGYWVLLDWGVS